MTNELTSLNVQNVEVLYLCLLKQIRGGDISSKNLALCDSILKLLCERHKPWFDLNMRIIPTFVYTYLRVIADHKPNQLHQLQQREIKHIIDLLRDKVGYLVTYTCASLYLPTFFSILVVSMLRYWKGFSSSIT